MNSPGYPESRCTRAVLAVGALALASFVVLAWVVTRASSNALDGVLRTWILVHRTEMLSTAARWMSTIGSVNPLIVFAVAACLYLWLRGRPRAGAALLLAPAVALMAFDLVKVSVGRARPAGGAAEDTFAFPSAHSAASASICCAVAWVFWRERIANAPACLSFAVLAPLAIGISRIVLDVHWVTDVLGGWSLGVLIAAASAAVYELALRTAGSGQQGAAA